MTITVAAFPFDIRLAQVESNKRQVLDVIQKCGEVGVQLLVLPEKWTTSFVVEYSRELRRESEDALNEVHAAATAVDLIVVGSAAGGDGDKPENVAHLLGAAGNLRPYSKRMLFSPTGEGRQVERGVSQPVAVETAIGRIMPVVCYDLRFPEICREALYQQADILVCCAQWPTPRVQLFELLSRARAAENQVFTISCNRSGTAALDGMRPMTFPESALIINPLGEVSARCDDGSLLISEIDLEMAIKVRTQVPISRDLRKAGLWPNHD
jgi:predicted amidohydrolase